MNKENKKQKPNIIERAQALVDSGKVHKITDDTWWIESQRKNVDKVYHLNYVTQECECPSYVRPCKHWHSVNIVKLKDLEQILYEVQARTVKKIGIIQ